VSADTHTYTNPKYPILTVVGAPGDVEVNPRTCNEANQINCSGNYGFGYFSAISATKAVFSWNTTVPVAGSPDPTFSDYFTVIKN